MSMCFCIFLKQNCDHIVISPVKTKQYQGHTSQKAIRRLHWLSTLNLAVLSSHGIVTVPTLRTANPSGIPPFCYFTWTIHYKQTQ